jgi:hypothetical protein
MKERIVLLNVLKYKNDKGEGTRVGFIFANSDKVQDTDKFIGYSELSQFYDADTFSKFKKEMIGKPVDAYFKVVSSPSNPLKTRSIIEKIEYENNVINLIQPE